MNREKKLKITAAIAAIMQFEAENQAAAGGVSQQVLPVQPALPLWSMAGRQDMMAMRELWQRRMGR